MGKIKPQVLAKEGFIKYHMTLAIAMLAESIKISKNAYTTTKKNIDEALISNSSNNSFDSTLGSHILITPATK